MQHRHTNLNVNKLNKLNITYLNVCGISSKLLNPDFETLINNYDILVLVETKTDEYNNIKLPNEYACYAKHRIFFKKKSGGIIIIYKKNTVNFFEIYSF
jgi:exonuclease III